LKILETFPARAEFVSSIFETFPAASGLNSNPCRLFYFPAGLRQQRYRNIFYTQEKKSRKKSRKNNKAKNSMVNTKIRRYRGKMTDKKFDRPPFRHKIKKAGRTPVSV